MLVAAHLAIVGLILIAIVLGLRKERRMPVRVSGYDEVNCLLGVVFWASREPAISAKLPWANAMRIGYQVYLGWWLRLPQAELNVLAPFIDAMIEGRGPPLDLPPEYEDYRPRVLSAFKARMEAEGLWPKASVPV
jgi:hypothetical protein